MSAYFPISKANWDKYRISITSNYGWRILNGKKNWHSGTDFAPNVADNKNIPCIACQEGELSTGKDSSGALWCYIKGVDGRGYLTVHHSRFLKTSGHVKAGDEIAIMGTTGNSTGIHCHLTVRPNYNNSSVTVDPMQAGLLYFTGQNPTPMIKIKTFPKLMKFTAFATPFLNVRIEPNGSPTQDLGDLMPNYVWYGNVYAEGQSVEGETKWVQVAVPEGQPNAGVVGYASAKYIKIEEVPTGSDAECQVKLAEANKTITTLTTENNTLKADNESKTTQLKAVDDALKILHNRTNS